MAEKYYFVYDQKCKEVMTEKEVLEFATEQFFDKKDMFDEESLLDDDVDKNEEAYNLGEKMLSGYKIQTVDEAKTIFSVVYFKVKQISYPENPKIVIQEYEDLEY